jgi:hypothetical protein
MDMMEYQEGYADGLARAGLQDRSVCCADLHDTVDYDEGFLLGSLDRKAMLAAQNKGE